jgi:hypothetical protein
MSAAVFACPCGEVFREDAYPYRITWRQIVAVHQDRCDQAPLDADPFDAPELRPVRQAANETTPSFAATQLNRACNLFALLVARPTLLAASLLSRDTR